MRRLTGQDLQPDMTPPRPSTSTPNLTRRWVGMGLLGCLLAWSVPSLAHSGRKSRVGGYMRLLLAPEVQKEVRLTPEQTAEVEKYAAELRERSGRMMFEAGRTPVEDLPKRFETYRLDQEKRLGSILDSRQMARIKQLDLQRSGIRAILQPGVQEELRLSGEQRSRVDGIMASEGESFRSGFQDLSPSGAMVMTAAMREETRRRFGDIWKATDQKLNNVLTDGQRRQFQTMQGTPFRFPESLHFPGR